MTTLQDGSIMFPKRGKPPPDIPNYERDPGDPYHFLPAYVPCRHRIALQQVKPCGNVFAIPFCDLKAEMVSVPFCNRCEVEPKT